MAKAKKAKRAAPKKSAKKKSSAKGSFVNNLLEAGFQEIGSDGQPVEGGKYNNGWHGLGEAKTSAKFTRGNQRVEMSLANEQGQPGKHMKVFTADIDQPIFHTNAGVEPPPDFWENYVKQ